MLIREAVGRVMRAERKRKRVPLYAAAHHANVSTSYLSEVETGKKEPSSEVVASICEALGLSQSMLLARVSDLLLTEEQKAARMNEMKALLRR